MDLDPYGNCYPQIAIAAKLLKEEGVVLLSSGDIQRVVRGLRMRRFPGSRKYRGRRAVFWAEEVWIPYVRAMLKKEIPNIELVHFFASPVLIRAIFATPKQRRQLATIRTRPRYLGWFREAANDPNLA
jgi:hypothetical protein